MLIPLLLACVLSSVQDPLSLEEAILRSERIGLGRVERVIEVETGELEATHSPVRIAVVRLEQKLVGPDGETLLHVVDASPIAPGPDGRALYFLERWNAPTATSGRRIERALDGEKVWQVWSNWSVSQSPDEVLLPQWLIYARLLEKESLAPDSVLASLDADISRCLPRIEARRGSIVTDWTLALGPDRKVTETRGPFEVTSANRQPLEVISAERWNELLQLVERVAFFELPEVVGHWIAPDETTSEIELHTRLGKHAVRIHSAPPGKPDDLSAWTRAREVWNALPGASKTSL